MSGWLPDGCTQADIDRHLGGDDDLCPHGRPVPETCPACRDEAAADYDADGDPLDDDPSL